MEYVINQSMLPLQPFYLKEKLINRNCISETNGSLYTFSYNMSHMMFTVYWHHLIRIQLVVWIFVQNGFIVVRIVLVICH